MRFSLDKATVAAARAWNPLSGNRPPGRLPRASASAADESFLFCIITPGLEKIPFAGVFKGRTASCHPDEIIRAMRRGRHMRALRLVVRWGNLARCQRQIYRRGRAALADALRRAAAQMRATRRIEGAWKIFTEELGWGVATSSKYLHFLARAQFPRDKNIPVPLDNAVLLARLWPDFVRHAAACGHPRPPRWRGASCAAYAAYLTAMLTWARACGCTAARMEAAVFDAYA